MNKKNLFLVVTILSGIVFLNSISEILFVNSESDTIFGSIWLFRLLWLSSTVIFLFLYLKVKKEGKESN